MWTHQVRSHPRLISPSLCATDDVSFIYFIFFFFFFLFLFPLFVCVCVWIKLIECVVWVMVEGRADDRSKRSSRREYAIRNRPRHTATDRGEPNPSIVLSSPTHYDGKFAFNCKVLSHYCLFTAYSTQSLTQFDHTKCSSFFRIKYSYFDFSANFSCFFCSFLSQKKKKIINFCI